MMTRRQSNILFNIWIHQMRSQHEPHFYVCIRLNIWIYERMSEAGIWMLLICFLTLICIVWYSLWKHLQQSFILIDTNLLEQPFLQAFNILFNVFTFYHLFTCFAGIFLLLFFLFLISFETFVFSHFKMRDFSFHK